MLRYVSKALLGFALILFSLLSFADYVPSRETVKYTYIFYKQLAINIELQKSLSNRISQESHSKNCITPDIIAKYAPIYKTPRGFIDALTKFTNNECEVNNGSNSKTISSTELEKYSLYILFSSEWSKNIESSLGHIRLAFMKDDAFMFDPVFTFSAYNFYSPETQKASFSKYINAVINSVDGKYSQSYFFDSYYDTVINESREIHRFKVNSAINIEDFYEELLLTTQKITDYNFFTKNCSSESLNLINTRIEKSTPIKAFTPPSKQLSTLINNNTINYLDTFIVTSPDVRLKLSSNELDEVIYDRLSSISSSSTPDLSFTLYESPRPKYGYLDFFSKTKALQINTNLNNKRTSISLMSKTIIDSISRNAPSFAFDLGYNINSQVYIGVGEALEKYGFSTMIGYSNDLKWSSYSRFHASYEKFDIALHYSANIETSNMVNTIDFYPTSNFSMSFVIDNSNQKFGLHYYF